MNRDLSLRKKRFIDPRWLFAAASAISILATYSVTGYSGNPGFETLRSAADSFWHGVIPYGRDTASLFLYGPLFNIIFTPFALLPEWIAPYLWNFFNLSLFFLAVFSLPDSIRTEQKCRFFLFLLPLAIFSQLSFRFDIVSASLALFAFSLLESGFYKWGITVVLISAFSGGYGIIQLLTLPFYPRILKNTGYTFIAASVFFASPLLSFPLSDLTEYYRTWFASVSASEVSGPFYTLFCLKPLFRELHVWSMTARTAMLGFLLLIVFGCRKRASFFPFRAGATGILAGWAVLFGMTSTPDTYLIALSGFMLWYYSKPATCFMDRAVLWCNFAVLTAASPAVLFSETLREGLMNTATPNVWVFAATSIWMAAYTFFGSSHKFATQHFRYRHL